MMIKGYNQQQFNSISTVTQGKNLNIKLNEEKKKRLVLFSSFLFYLLTSKKIKNDSSQNEFTIIEITRINF